MEYLHAVLNKGAVVKLIYFFHFDSVFLNNLIDSLFDFLYISSVRKFTFRNSVAMQLTEIMSNIWIICALFRSFIIMVLSQLGRRYVQHL